MHPSPEARLAAQEELTALLHAHIKQLSLDMHSHFEQLSQRMQLGFIQAHASIEEHMATKEDVQALEQRIKGEMGAMEERIITAMRDVLQQKP